MTSQDFLSQATAQMKEERHKLLGIKIGTPTDEQIAKTKGEYPDYQPGASLEIEWEPMSYRIEGGPFGNLERDRVPVTHQVEISAGTLVGLTADELQAVRDNGWLGLKDDKRVNQAKVYALPRSYKTTKRPYDRLMGHIIEAGLTIKVDSDGSVTGTAGQIFTPDAGQIFVTETGMDPFPMWDPTLNRGRGGWKEDGRAVYMRYPIKKDPGYVQPEDVPVVIRNANQETATAEAPTTASTGGGLDAGKLREAAEIMGMIGSPASDFEGADKQRALVARGPSKGAVIFGALGQQAAAGGLVDFLVESKALAVEDGVLV